MRKNANENIRAFSCNSLTKNSMIIKVAVAVVLSLAVGGFVYYAYQPRLVCRESPAMRDAIPIERDQTTFEHIYTIHNTSLRTITLDGIKASCNCQSVSITNRVILPRSKGEVKAIFAVARNAAGERHADFLVFANKIEKPLLRLQMTYSFELGVWAYPEQISLGRVVRGKPVEFAISVRQEKVPRRTVSTVQSVVAEGITFEVLPVQDESPRKKEPPDEQRLAGTLALQRGASSLRGRPEEPSQPETPTLQGEISRDNTAPEDSFLLNQKVIGRFTNDFEVGYHNRVVTIHTDHPDYPVLTVPVRWESVSELNFSPTTLHFGFMGAESKSSRAITLISESESLSVREAKVSGDGFRLESQKQVAPNRVEFLIEATTGTTSGVHKGQLHVQLSDGKECQAGLLLIVE